MLTSAGRAVEQHPSLEMLARGSERGALFTDTYDMSDDPLQSPCLLYTSPSPRDRS